MSFDTSWNTNADSVRLLSANSAATLDRLHFLNLSADSVRNLTSLRFANPTSGANRNLTSLCFAFVACYALVDNLSSVLSSPGCNAVVNLLGLRFADPASAANGTSFWLTYPFSDTILNFLGSLFTAVLGNAIRNFLTVPFATILGATYFFSFASWNPNFLATGFGRCLAANNLLAARNILTAACAGIVGPRTWSSHNFPDRTTRNSI